MNDTERVIGKLEEFREWVKDQFMELKEDAKETRRDVQEMKQFKWQIIGGAGAASFFVALVTTALGFLLKQ